MTAIGKHGSLHSPPVQLSVALPALACEAGRTSRRELWGKTRCQTSARPRRPCRSASHATAVHACEASTRHQSKRPRKELHTVKVDLAPVIGVELAGGLCQSNRLYRFVCYAHDMATKSESLVAAVGSCGHMGLQRHGEVRPIEAASCFRQLRLPAWSADSSNPACICLSSAESQSSRVLTAAPAWHAWALCNIEVRRRRASRTTYPTT